MNTLGDLQKPSMNMEVISDNGTVPMFSTLKDKLQLKYRFIFEIYNYVEIQ